jgi:hypothetical protein
VDENYPISVKQWIRSWGGCALLWRKELDQYIDCITDGGNRLVSVILNQEEKPLYIIAAYMPTTGTGNDLLYMMVV